MCKKINLHERNCQKFNEICYSYQLLGFALRNKERNKCVVQENEQTQNAEIGSFKGKYSCYLHKTFQIFFLTFAFTDDEILKEKKQDSWQGKIFTFQLARFAQRELSEGQSRKGS